MITLISITLFGIAALTDFTNHFLEPLLHLPGDFMELDELFVVLIFLPFAFAVFSWRRMADQHRFMKQLQYRLEFENLIAFLSSTFVNLDPSETDREINKALRQIGEFAQVDRSYVFKFTEDGARMYNSHEWCAKGISPFIQSLQSISTDTFPCLMKKLRALEVFHVPCVADLPPEAQAEKVEFVREGIQSLICVPMVHRGNLIGFMGFDSVQAKKAWSEDTIALLKLMGEVITNALIRKQTEESLRISEERFSVFMDHLPAAAFIKDSEGRAVYVNRYLQELFGWTDWKNKLTYSLLPPEMSEQMMADDRQALAEGLVSRIETITDVHGAERIFQTLKFPVSMANQTPLLGGISLDITENRRAEEGRRKIEAQMQHTQKLESLGVLAGGIAHDFNNLLTSILGYAGLALMELPLRSPARDNVEQIEIAGRRAAELTKQMLAYAGKGALVTQILRLPDIVREMSHLLEVTVSRKCILQYNIREPLPPIEGDPTQIRQVIMNLILNAAESLPDQTGAIAVNMGVMQCDRSYLNRFHLGKDLPEGDYVYLEVEDTGCGMSPETQSRIFDPFFTTKFTGRGLGLAAVLGIVRSHRGAIRVTSVPGQGSVFRVLFPISANSADTIPEAVRMVPAWKGSGTVLIIDDEESVRNLASMMLRKMGFEVLLAGDGVDGLDVFNLHREEIRAVLLDMTMPRMDGRKTFQEIRRLDPGARIILSSGYSEQDATAQIREQGLAGFVQKPYHYNELMSAVRKAVEGEAASENK